MEQTEEVYVLKLGAEVVRIADDFEWLNEQMSCYPAVEQDRMTIENHDLFRVKGKGD